MKTLQEEKKEQTTQDIGDWDHVFVDTCDTSDSDGNIVKCKTFQNIEETANRLKSHQMQTREVPHEVLAAKE